MKFITTLDMREYAKNPVYEVEDYGLDEEKSIKRYVRDELVPYDMEGGMSEDFHIRFESGECFRIYFEAWASHDPECEIEHFVEVKPIPEDECLIKEAPGEYEMVRSDYASQGDMTVSDDEILLGFSLKKDKESLNGKFYPEESGCLSPHFENDVVGVKVHASTLHATIFVPLNVLIMNGYVPIVWTKRKIQEADVSPSIP